MKGKYKAAFILPVDTKKMLGENGWEFNSSNRLSLQIKDLLIDVLKLKFLENYLQIYCFINEDIKMSVFYDDKNEIESIYFQVYNDRLTTLTDLFIASGIANESELFIP
ncbi:hypothetical protein [Methylicorpusculum sp.]|uniref:hypothetical protein n=1 Tax=Methylicorpusculum sp. TaxID=2713644 RepID=UPI002AB98224|nr:hypothetical protein [Methylicorpusculum sp.]MDZ4150440.1 hypothetical protein [Methylicorpusculum sp.]